MDQLAVEPDGRGESIVLRDGEAAWSASHYAITADAVAEATAVRAEEVVSARSPAATSGRSASWVRAVTRGLESGTRTA